MKDEVNNKMATLRGWTVKKPTDSGYQVDSYVDSKGKFVMWVSGFDPYENITQAFECVESFLGGTLRDFEIEHTFDDDDNHIWIVLIREENLKYVVETEDVELATAITKALCLALEGGE